MWRALPRQVFVTALLVAGTAEAAPLVYEPFSYDPGVLAGQTATGQDLTGVYTGTPVPPGSELVVAEPGLDFGSLANAPAATGNRVSPSTGMAEASVTIGIDADIMVPSGEGLFASAVLRFDDSTNAGNLAKITLANEQDESISFSVFDNSGYRFFEATTHLVGGGGIGRPIPDGNVLFLIMRFANPATPDDFGTLEVVGYDAVDTDALPSAFAWDDPGAWSGLSTGSPVGVFIESISSITLTLRGTVNLDELRIGTSYADVALPEPGAALLLGSAVTAAALARARSRS